MNLTAAAVLLLGCAMLLGVAGQWSEAVGAFPWWRVIVALLVVGLLYEMIAVRRWPLSARWRTAERTFLGRPERAGLEIMNRSRQLLTVQTAPTFPDALAPLGVAAGAGEHAGFDAPAGEPGAADLAGDPAGSADDDGDTRTLLLPPGRWSGAQVDVRPIRLGVHPWPELPVRVLGPLGLAWWSRTLETGSTVAVLPDTLGRRAVVASSAEAGTTAQSKLGGGQELDHLREYRAGDPRHTIDWKASARASRLITRVFSEDQHLEIVILLDAGRTSRTELDGMSQLGHYVNLAARFAEYSVAGDDRVGLVVFADRPLRVVPPDRGLAAVTRIRRALADLEPHAVESDALEAALHVRRLVRHRCLAVVLTDLYESSATGRLAQAARLLAPKHLPLMVGLLGEEVGALAGGEAREWLDPYRGLAAREYERHVRANVARLGQLGALAMTARPAELDAKVIERYRLLRSQHRI